MDNTPFVPLLQPSRYAGLRKNIKGFVYNDSTLINAYLLSKE